MRTNRFLALLALPVTAGAAPLAAPPKPAPSEIVAAAPDAAWRPVDPAELLVMGLAGGRRVVIELAPAFAPVHVANIRLLARAHWFDGAAIVRVQDGYVVQWAGAENGKPLPAGLVARPPAEYERAAAGLAIRPLPWRDSYAPETGFAGDWPVGRDGARAWLTHCYGSVGVGRDMPPDTGTGAELYAVIGQAPRQLDRNIALVGRILDGMDALSSRPRGTGDMGFYTDAGQRLTITSVRIAVDMPAADRPRYETMRTDAPSFAAYLDARANRRDPFYIRPAGALDICNAPIPVRKGR